LLIGIQISIRAVLVLANGDLTPYLDDLARPILYRLGTVEGEISELALCCFFFFIFSVVSFVDMLAYMFA
jgi:hypothetical protein